MALFKGSIVNEISGKLGGNVFAHNAGGQYVRQFRVPTNPNTSRQVQRRNAMAQASVGWRDVLTLGQRDAWNAIAGTITRTNRLGDPITLNGQQAYIRAATVAQLIGEAIPATAPSVTGETELGTIAGAVISAASATQAVLPIGATPPWAASDDGRLVAFISPNVSPAINFYRGPYAYAGVVDGDGTTAVNLATFDWTSLGTPPANNVTGLKRFIRVYAYLEGRLSAELQIAAIAS